MSVRQLILVRHAKSSWDDIDLDDHDRPLNKRGERNAPAMGERLKTLGMCPDVVFTSSAVRAATTAQIICGKLDFPAEEVIRKDDLYLADVPQWLEIIRELDDAWKIVMAFGHNPGLTELVAGVWRLPILNVPTCGAVVLTFDGGTWKKAALDKPVTATFDYPKNKSALPEVLR